GDDRQLADLLVHRPRNVPGRCLQVEDGVEHELQLAAERAEHRVETDLPASKRVMRLRLDAEDAHDQPARQRRRADRDDGREGVLAQTAEDDEENTTHTFYSHFALRLISANS